MSLETSIAEMELDRQILRDRLAAMEMKRDRTSSPSKRQFLDFKIWPLKNHLRDIDVVLDARRLARSNQTALRTKQGS